MPIKNFFFPPRGEDYYHKYHTPLEKALQEPLSSFKKFINDQITASFFLLLAAIIAIIWVSIDSFSSTYHHFQTFRLGIEFGESLYRTDLKTIVNDFLMTFFFFLLGLEIKKEFLAGDLNTNATRNTVIFAALGGVIAPAVIFLVLSPDRYDLKGWGIPVATDTAFALGILALFRNKVPASLFAFVAAFAVIDDLIAILILAIFYSSSIDPLNIMFAATAVIFLVIINLMGIRSYVPYLIVGSLVWVFIEISGIHGTLAGVLVALTIPARPKSGPRQFLEKVDELTSTLEDTEAKKNTSLLEDDVKHDIIEQIGELAQETVVPLAHLQHKMEPTIFLIILPLFALINAGIPMRPQDLAAAFSHSLPISIFFALVLGKLIGISLSTKMACQLGIAKLPQGTRFGHIVGVSILAGIGFTMSIFIAELAFGAEEEIIVAKSGIFVASLCAGLLGIIYFLIYTRHKPTTTQSTRV